jgi:integrase
MLLNFITWNVDPVLIHLGPLAIRWYGLLWAIGIYATLLVTQKLYKNDAAKPNDYIFPFLDSNADYAQANTSQMIATLSPELKVKLLNTVNSKNTLIDKYLKEIGSLVGVEENLTMHIARHSFAKRAADLKISNNISKSLLGHSNLKETETYMGDFSTQETDDAMNTIFSYGNDPKAELINKIKGLDTEKIELIMKFVTENTTV